MSDALTDTLGPEQNSLWQQYLSAETSGQRKLALLSLRNFVEALQADSEERRHGFTETFCRQMADDGKKLSLREPLFAGIIGPYLVSAYHKGEKDAGRWLAYFSLNFWKMPPSKKLIELTGSLSPIALLTEAFRRDPDDVRAREMLIGELANQFEYAVHEVPSGVLYSQNGTTIAGCQEWLNYLALFREVVQKHNVVVKYEKRMRYWDFHFRGYAEYLTHRDQYENYADYIERRWTEE